MLNLNEAIQHCKEKVKELRVQAYEDYHFDGDLNKRVECLECAKEHGQLAEWLEELEQRRESDRWISVDEALPEKEGWYLVDRKERTFSIQYFFFDTADHKPYWASECKVYYWRHLPKAPESEETNEYKS